MSANASKIRERITALENDLAKQNARLAEAEAALAAAYAEGTDPEPHLAALTRAHDETAGKIDALVSLDATWHATSLAEYDAGIAAIRSRAEAGYREANRALVAAMREVERVLIKHAPTVRGSVDGFADSIAAGMWNDFFLVHIGNESRALGQRPSDPPRRCVDGSLLDPSNPKPFYKPRRR